MSKIEIIFIAICFINLGIAFSFYLFICWEIIQLHFVDVFEKIANLWRCIVWMAGSHIPLWIGKLFSYKKTKQ